MAARIVHVIPNKWQHCWRRNQSANASDITLFMGTPTVNIITAECNQRFRLHTDHSVARPCVDTVRQIIALNERINTRHRHRLLSARYHHKAATQVVACCVSDHCFKWTRSHETIFSRHLASIDFRSKWKLWVFGCSLLTRERMNRFAPNVACLFLETRKKTQQDQNSGKLSWVRVLVRAVPVARKLSTIEELCRDQSCLFQRGDYRNKRHSTQKLPWVRVPVKIVSVARKVSTIEERRQDQSSVFRGGDLRNKGYNTQKTVLDSSPGEDKFRDNFYCDIRRYV
jgi:hypothetical protein